jgi:glycosyltransferase involved in cell wall biosynthesis
MDASHEQAPRGVELPGVVANTLQRTPPLAPVLGPSDVVRPARMVSRRRSATRTSRPRVSAIIPAMNEAESLPHVLLRLSRIVDEVILVDGHSTDDTIAVARESRSDIRVVTQTHRGKGNALACGFAVASGDIIVMLDADGSTDPAEIPLFVSKLLNGADFAKGSRYMDGGESEDLTRIRRYGNAFLTTTVNALFGVQYTDLCYGYMAFWRRCLPQLAVDCSGFEVETLLTLRAARAGLNIVEVPSIERARIHGESNLRPVRDGVRILRTIVRERRAGERAADLAPAWAALVGQLDHLPAADDTADSSRTQPEPAFHASAVLNAGDLDAMEIRPA